MDQKDGHPLPLRQTSKSLGKTRLHQRQIRVRDVREQRSKRPAILSHQIAALTPPHRPQVPSRILHRPDAIPSSPAVGESLRRSIARKVRTNNTHQRVLEHQTVLLHEQSEILDVRPFAQHSLCHRPSEAVTP